MDETTDKWEDEPPAAPAEPKRRWSRLDVAVLILTFAGLWMMLDPVPDFSTPRERVRRERCVGNLKQIRLALTMYSEENSSYFPLTPWGNNFEPLNTGQVLNDGKVYGCPSAVVLATTARQSNYLYLGSGVRDDDPSAAICVIACDQQDNHPNRGWMNAVFVDGHAEGARPDGSKTWNDPDYLLAQARMAWPKARVEPEAAPAQGIAAVIALGLGLLLAGLAAAVWLVWPSRKDGGT